MEYQSNSDVVIIGAGLAGLTCGVLLHEAGKRVRILEATDRVGGRVVTDELDGFRLDYGFQVLLTAYPACKSMLDYDALQLRLFEPGALVRHRQSWKLLGDPWRRPGQAFSTAFNPVGSLGDKLRIARLRHDARRGSLQSLYERPNRSTELELRARGFSDRMIDHFFRPFIGGVFLDESLQVSNRMLEFVFRMFSEGNIAIPAKGMSAIPKQLASRLPEDTVELRTTVQNVDGKRIRLSDDATIECDHVVVATESNAAGRLLDLPELSRSWGSTATLYYATDELSESRKLLMLRGDESGPIQTACVLSNVAPEYAPPGKHLISVSLASDPTVGSDPEEVDPAVRSQLRDWFGNNTDDWERLGIYHVPYGLPQSSLDPIHQSIRGSDYGREQNVWIGGDHTETPSIQGAMNSGIRIAEAILGSVPVPVN
ncbi:MAG: NAD(P)/FAD-dependent oxidoreductase [Planctomycetota bacterium]